VQYRDGKENAQIDPDALDRKSQKATHRRDEDEEKERHG
jgi:hypothetical protein